MVYELLASVAHIRDAKSGSGNLVAHVHVGETYHQRKEGITTTQFYLFNDFSINDIEKVILGSLNLTASAALMAHCLILSHLIQILMFEIN